MNQDFEVTLRADGYGCKAILMDGVRIGEVRSNRKGNAYGVYLHGIYWRRDMPNQSSGAVGTRVYRVMEAIRLTKLTYGYLGLSEPVMK